LGGNNDFLHLLKEKKYLKILPNMQRVNIKPAELAAQSASVQTSVNVGRTPKL